MHVLCVGMLLFFRSFATTLALAVASGIIFFNAIKAVLCLHARNPEPVPSGFAQRTHH
jgi:hypothetical protein